MEKTNRNRNRNKLDMVKSFRCQKAIDIESFVTIGTVDSCQASAKRSAENYD